jgi:hypothetical protein
MTLDEFREKALGAMDEMNARVDADRAGIEARRIAEQAERGVKRARGLLRSARFGIAAVVAVAAAGASVWDLMRLMAELGASPWWGVAAGGAIDLGWIYLLLEVYSHRDDPAKALKPYKRTTYLLVLSAVLNAVSGVVSGGDGLGMVVLGVVSVLMPVMLKTVITPLVLGGSLASELLLTRAGRARVADAAHDRHGRALAAYDAAYRLDSERAEHSASIALQRQRAHYEAERESIALELQRTREDLAAAAFEASRRAAGLTAAPSDVASATPAVAPAMEVPALPAAGAVSPDQVAALLAALGQAATVPAPAAPADDVASATPVDDSAYEDDADTEQDHLPPLEPPTLASLSKADAVRLAMRKRPGYSSAQIADLLLGHDVKVSASYVRQVRTRDEKNGGAAAEQDQDAEIVQIRARQ